MFELAWPWVLILLPLPLAIRYLWPPAPTANDALNMPGYSALCAQDGQTASSLASGQRWQRLLAGLVWLLLILAACRPQWLSSQPLHEQSSRASMLAVDLSASMLTSDLSDSNESRFAITQELLHGLLQAHPEDRFGLIFFATQAFLQAPLTFDHRNLQHWLDSAEPGMAGDNTAIGDAIGLGIKKLRHLPAAEKNLVLLTDGANNSGIMPPLTAARFAASEGIRIHTLGIGQSALGSQAGPDQELLQEIAWLTGGRYLLVDSAQTRQYAAAFFQQLPSSLAPQQHWQTHELYPWPLAAALLLGTLHALWTLMRRAIRSSQRRSRT